MNFGNTVNTPKGNKEAFGSSFNFKDVILRYLKLWYWFVLGVVVSSILAYLYIRYTIPQYNVSATLAISQEESISESGLTAFKDLGLLDNTKSTVENEIQVIRSRTLINNVVKKLGLNIQYFTKGVLLETEDYPKSIIEINFIEPDSIVNLKSGELNVRIDSENNFSYLDKDGIELTKYSFGKTTDTKIGKIIITPKTGQIKKHLGQTIRVKVSPVKNITESYRNKLAIYSMVKGTSIVKIALNDPVKLKAKDIINNLIDEYSVYTIQHKKKISNRTSDFIERRLKLISEDLTQVDDEAAGYKSKFGLTNNVDSQTERVADFDSRNVQEITRYNTQLRLVGSMQNFIRSQDAMNDPIPSNLGFDDPSISSSVSRYNTLIFQRKRLLKSSSVQNPVVVNIDEQIRDTRQILESGLKSLRSSINIRLNSLKTQEKYFSGKLYTAPTRQKDLRIIEREQTVKEQLYLYLLQKREEAQITSEITLPNSKIIDRASILSSFPVSPNKKLIYIGAICLGFFIPFLIIYLKDLFNTKVGSKEDLERVLSMPIIGVIPKAKQKNKLVVSKNSRTPISEAFRILRTNLDFLMAGIKKDSGKVIFVTSSISGEGKTLISSNIAKVLAVSGSKVAYVGTDFRDPKFHSFLELPKGKDTIGFTNYIMDSKLKPQDVIYTEKGDDPMYILPAGAIPPNPSGLLMNQKVKTMFAYLEENYDYIVVDTAPVSLVADTMLISNLADLSIYVIRENYSDKGLLKMPEQYYQEKRLKNIAVLLNDAESKMGYSYGYGGKK